MESLFKCAFIVEIMAMALGVCQAGELSNLIELAYRNNPGISAKKASFEASDSLVGAAWAPEDPMIGVSTLNRNVETKYGTITQKFRFPLKYYLQSRIQKSRSNYERALFENERRMIRERVITLYYSIYSTQKIIQLTRANILAVKEFSRVAEKKYAAGKSSQGDSMKAHFELTQLELDLIRQTQKEEALQDALQAVLNQRAFQKINLYDKQLGIPTFEAHKVSQGFSELNESLKAHSPLLRAEVHLLDESEEKSALSSWEFAPDFQIQYQKRIAGNPTDSEIFSVGMTFPLWFWNKGSKASAASSLEIAQKYKVLDATQKLISEVRDLQGRVNSNSKILKIYQTSLIPQAEGAYNSSRGAYRANRTSFLDLLDSERSLYRVKTGFYQSLSQYVESLSALETSLGLYVSNTEALSASSVGGRNVKE